MTLFNYNPESTCAKHILADIEPETNKIISVSFMGGCQGNLSAISKMIAGKTLQEVISMFKGNTCGKKQTSCTDQLAVMFEKILAGEIVD